MATIKAGLAFNMTDTETWYGDVLKANSSTIVLDDGYYRGQYSGSFRYSDGELSGGTLKGYKQWIEGKVHYEVSGFSVSAVDAAEIIDSGDAASLLESVLSKNDTITGSNYDDYLMGFDGKDVISGGAGDDEILGGAGSDKLTGGKGADTFVFSADDFDFSSSTPGADVITDFKLSEGDQIDLSELGSVAVVASKANGVEAGETLFYDSSTGTVYYDYEGDGSVVALVKITGTKITEDDGAFV